MFCVISFGGGLCYSGPSSSSRALVWMLGCLGCLEEAGPFEASLLLLICLLFAPPHIMSVVILFCVLVAGGPVTFASRSEVDVWLQSLFGSTQCFSSVPRVKGALLFWS